MALPEDSGWRPHAFEAERSKRFDDRRADWRIGPIVYQVHVDRFAPSRRIDAKSECYAAPRKLMPWSAKPKREPLVEDERITGAEIQFWGGDLESLAERIGHIAGVGASVLYLNPIFDAYSNHKYDANDFFRIDPQYGSIDDFRRLRGQCAEHGLRLMLDGVFNHMGRRSPLFQKELQEPRPPAESFFHIGPEHPNGWRGWRNVANLPELNLGNPAVRDFLFAGRNSVVQHWLRDEGVDGWRLDVAPDLGFEWLAQLRAAAREARPGCAVVGECWNWPGDWLRVLDGVLNMFLRQWILDYCAGSAKATAFSRVLERLVRECDFDGLLRSHLVLDNHDVPRLATMLPGWPRRRLARILQFTLPGAPVVHYGSEVGMEGGHDPRNRAPMRWDLVRDGNPDLDLVRRLASLREANPALRVGDCTPLDSDGFVAFLRSTDRALETLLVIVNAGRDAVEERIAIRDSRWMDAAPLECLLTGARAMMESGTIRVSVPAGEARILRTVDRGGGPGYSQFKRIL